MITIYKYDITEKSSISIPMDAMFLSARIDPKSNHVCVWYKIDTDNAMDTRTFHIIGTGHKFPDGDLRYRDTIVTPIGFVWHVFEEF